MSSQLDLDQGGTFRQTQKFYLGPSVGWVQAPSQNILPVNSAGPIAIARGMNLILVNFNGAAVLNLASSKASLAGPQAIPQQFVIVPTVIVDAGGFASAVNTITINPFGTETIDGLASIQIVQPYGAFVMKPNIDLGGWTLTQ